jgi:hypothetical protein
MAQGAQGLRTAGGSGWLRVIVAVVLAIVVALAVWLIVKGNEESKPTATSSTASAATLDTLRALPGEVGHPVYWVGARHGFTYELTEVDGNLFIRYLPFGVAVGDPRPDFLTIGTYEVANAHGSLKRQARQRGGHLRRTAGGGIAVWNENRPQSVYLAFPRSALEIEIYAASAERARRLAATGAVEPIR